MEVCGQAASSAEAIKILETVRPDVMVVDVQLQADNGLDLVERIRARDETIGMLVWSMYPDAIYAQRALRAGALGYINKRNATNQIVDAIRRVREGRIYLGEEIAEQLLGSAVGRSDRHLLSGVECLSRHRELEVFRLIGQGPERRPRSPNVCTAACTRSSPTGRKSRTKLLLKTAGELNRAAVQWMLENG